MAKKQIRHTATDQVRFGSATISKWQIKVVLAVFGFGIMVGVLLYTKVIVDELVGNEIRTVDLYAKLLARAVQQSNDEDLLFYLENAYASINFPVIITPSNEEPVYPFQQFMLNVDLDTSLTIQQQREYLRSMLAEMRTQHQPYEITNPEGEVVQKVFFANSAIVSRLRYMPMVEIALVGAFILLGYVAFSTIRKTEESNIWVGMAKEAAHQLGTPLSSLLAWIEILRGNCGDAALMDTTLNEMGQDIERLKIIANRFGKIGSQPSLESTEVTKVVEETCRYFDTRLPALGRRVVIERRFLHNMNVMMSAELFRWVLENLIRNAVDAIEKQDGIITITVTSKSNANTLILVTDNGKGMSAGIRKKIFKPGFTTKHRGWGLGLSLSKRIIEEYHHGRLYVKESQPGGGTTFAIELPPMAA